MNSIPASQLVNVIPSVLGAGGNPLSLNAVFLSPSVELPANRVVPFASQADVAAYFGPSSDEAAEATVYFDGYNGATSLPGTLYFALLNAADVAAFVRGASVAALTLSQIQALSGVITITINGDVVVTPSVNLSGATSRSNAAALITTGLQTTGAVFSGTGSQSVGVLTIASTVSGKLSVGDTVTGAGVFGGTATIVSFGTYTVLAGTGTVNVSTSGTTSTDVVDVSSGAICTYDSVQQKYKITSDKTGAASTIGFPSGTIATGLFLTSATGAELSQGAVAAVPATLMSTVVAQTQNWATFMTVEEQVLDTKLAFAAWVTAQNDRYMYVCQDTDPTALTFNATGSFGALTDGDDGVCPVWGPADKAAFICGTTASLDFTRTAGRITYAYKSQTGLTPDVTDATVAQNLIGNGYNFYGAYATANQAFQFLQNGQISGSWNWIDPFVNQIALNAAFQLAFMELLANTPAVPYNQQGYGLIRAAALDPISSALNFGSIQPGVTLSSAQAAAVNTAAGANIAPTLSTAGWYLQIKDPGAIVRGNRGSPSITFWYTDGGAVQKITMASIDVE